MNILKRLLNTGRPLDRDDYRFLDFYLDEPGKFLFFQMNRVDQHHALAVARTVLSEASYLPGLDLLILIKAALLHDVGKVEGDLNPFSRLFVGLVRRSRPLLRGQWSITNPVTFWQKLRYGFYVDLAHPARGAHMARIFGIEPSIVDMIRHHHDPPFEGQSPELTWLQLVDSRY
jgi:putative nucleotidyltransferase with HDIG domain